MAEPTTYEVLAHIVAQLTKARRELDERGADGAEIAGLSTAIALVGRVSHGLAANPARPLYAPYDQPATVTGPDGRQVWNDKRFDEEVE